MNIPEVAQIPSLSNWIINKSVLESLWILLSHTNMPQAVNWPGIAWHCTQAWLCLSVLPAHIPLQKDSQCVLPAAVLFSRNICAVSEGRRKLFQGGKRVPLNTKRNIDIPLKESVELKSNHWSPSTRIDLSP